MCEQLEGLTAKQESERGQLSEKDAQLTEQALKSKHRQRVLEGQVLYPCNPLSNANAGGELKSVETREQVQKLQEIAQEQKRKMAQLEVKNHQLLRITSLQKRIRSPQKSSQV